MVQPVYAEDLASQTAGAGSLGDRVVAAAAGPDTFTLEELHRPFATVVGGRRRLGEHHVAVGYSMTNLVGLPLREVMLARDKVRAD